MKKTKILAGMAMAVVLSGVLTGCGGSLSGVSAQDVMNNQDAKKAQQAAKVMNTVNVPNFDYSIERENIALRLKETNDPTAISWIYPMSAGRVIGRFPVRGKVTSGSKRLTNTVMKVKIDGGEYDAETYIPAPDEMGSYGDSGDYIFWFDPSGGYHQHRGDYDLSNTPYQLDLGNGVMTMEIDQKEMNKKSTYETAAKKSYAEDKKSIQGGN